MSVDFLKGVKVPKRFKSLWLPRMSGWVALHGYLQDVDKSDQDLFARLMVVELSRPSPRYAILERLKGSFDVARRRNEMRALAGAAFTAQ